MVPTGSIGPGVLTHRQAPECLPGSGVANYLTFYYENRLHQEMYVVVSSTPPYSTSSLSFGVWIAANSSGYLGGSGKLFGGTYQGEHWTYTIAATVPGTQTSVEVNEQTSYIPPVYTEICAPNLDSITVEHRCTETTSVADQITTNPNDEGIVVSRLNINTGLTSTYTVEANSTDTRLITANLYDSRYEYTAETASGDSVQVNGEDAYRVTADCT